MFNIVVTVGHINNNLIELLFVPLTLSVLNLLIVHHSLPDRGFQRLSYQFCRSYRKVTYRQKTIVLRVTKLFINNLFPFNKTV